MAVKPKPAFQVPKTLGACADALYTIRQERLKAQKVVDELETNEKAIKAHVIDTLPKSNASGIAGKLARVTVTTKTIAQVQDWPSFYAYVAKNKAFEMLQKRLGDAAIQERWDAGKKVPGVEPFTIVGVSVNKV